MLTSALHAVLQRSKALRTLFEAMALVQVKTRLALCAEVFAKAGLTVIYPTPCEETRETDVSRDSRQNLLIWSRLKGGGGDRRERGIMRLGKRHFDAMWSFLLQGSEIFQCNFHWHACWARDCGVWEFLGLHRTPKMWRHPEWGITSPWPLHRRKESRTSQPPRVQS